MADHFTIQQLDEFREAFTAYDKAGDGFIASASVKNLLMKMGQTCSKRECDEFMKQFDKGRTGRIDYPTFLQILVLKLRESYEDEETRHAFKVFDIDGSGQINAEELRTTMNSLGERLTREQVNEMIREADFDGDGQINYQEFIQMLKPSVTLK